MYHNPHDEYFCSSYRHYSRSCTCHYIRVSVIENIILEAIRRVSGYVRDNEAEFVERVREESTLQQETAVKESRKKLATSTRRRDEVSALIKKLYESYASGKIPEKHFSELLTGYDVEQAVLDGEIEKLQGEIDGFNADTIRADKFIEVVKRHTEFSEFSAGLLNEFVERVLVHEAVSVDGVRTQDIEIFFSFVGKLALPELVSGKPQEAMATQIPIKPQNDTGAADNEAMPKSENAAVSSQNGENKMPGTVNSAAQPKTAQSGAPAGTISNSS